MTSWTTTRHSANRPLWGLAAILILLSLLTAVVWINQDHLVLQIVHFCDGSWRELFQHAWLAALALLPVAQTVSLGTGAWTALRKANSTRRWVADFGRPVPSQRRLARIVEDVGLSGRVHLVSDDSLLAVTAGFARPRALISTGMISLLEDDELRAVLAHEHYHVVNRDPMKVWLVHALANALFFLPVAYDLRDAYLLRKELAADRHAGATVGERKALARALVKLLSAGSTPPVPQATAGHAARMQARLAHLTGEEIDTVTFSHVRVLVSLCVAVALVAVASALLVERAHFAKTVACKSHQLLLPWLVDLVN